MRAWIHRGLRRWLVVTAGGLFVLEGCDPSVRGTILSGVEGAATTLFTTFIQAFFETLQEPEDAAGTVRAIFESLPLA